MLAGIAQLGKPTLVCTIYDAVPSLTPALQTALLLFNDVVTRTAMRYPFDVLDLRTLLNEPGDFSERCPLSHRSKQAVNWPSPLASGRQECSRCAGQGQ